MTPSVEELIQRLKTAGAQSYPILTQAADALARQQAELYLLRNERDNLDDNQQRLQAEIERLTRQNTILRGILDRLVCCDTSSEIGQIITGKAAVDAARDYVRERKALAEDPTP
jgi:hypothetical protein